MPDASNQAYGVAHTLLESGIACDGNKVADDQREIRTKYLGLMRNIN